MPLRGHDHRRERPGIVGTKDDLMAILDIDQKLYSLTQPTQHPL